MQRDPRLIPARKVDAASPPLVDYHMHTDWTDGADTIQAMHEAAIRAGLKEILFSEHARDTSGDWFPAFAAAIRERDHLDCRALVGVEVKVKGIDGELDISEAIATECAMIMASVHRFPGEQGQIKGTTGGLSGQEAINIEYCLARAAIENPQTTILGHPFGMSLSRFRVTPPEHLFRDLIRRCRDHGVGFEINPHYHADTQELLTWCQEEDGLISLGSNAHAVGEVAEIHRSLSRAR